MWLNTSCTLLWYSFLVSPIKVKKRALTEKRSCWSAVCLILSFPWKLKLIRRMDHSFRSCVAISKELILQYTRMHSSRIYHLYNSLFNVKRMSNNSTFPNISHTELTNFVNSLDPSYSHWKITFGFLNHLESLHLSQNWWRSF